MSKKITQMSKTNRLDNRGGKREGAGRPKSTVFSAGRYKHLL